MAAGLLVGMKSSHRTGCPEGNSLEIHEPIFESLVQLEGRQLEPITPMIVDPEMDALLVASVGHCPGLFGWSVRLL